MRGFSFPSLEGKYNTLKDDDIIITGISYEEAIKFNKLLYSKGIYNVVYYNPAPNSLVTFKTIVEHKLAVLESLPLMDTYFESDIDQHDILVEHYPGMLFINE
jgi:hypothetical protein